MYLPDPAEIERLPLAERIYMAKNAQDAYRQAMYEVGQIHKNAIRILRSQGRSYGEIAKGLSISRTQAWRLVNE